MTLLLGDVMVANQDNNGSDDGATPSQKRLQSHEPLRKTTSPTKPAEACRAAQRNAAWLVASPRKAVPQTVPSSSSCRTSQLSKWWGYIGSNNQKTNKTILWLGCCKIGLRPPTRKRKLCVHHMAQLKSWQSWIGRNPTLRLEILE